MYVQIVSCTCASHANLRVHIDRYLHVYNDEEHRCWNCHAVHWQSKLWKETYFFESYKTIFGLVV